MSMTPERQMEILAQGAEEILPEGALLERLRVAQREQRPLRVKQGFDPTAPDIHLGHTVGLRKLRQFQELGHQVVLIVGDYTGLVGDPSGRSKTRPRLSTEALEENALTYLEQFFRVLDRAPLAPMLPVEVHRNGDWFSRMSFAQVMQLASQYTVARVLERDDFSKRYRENQPISLHELFYPLMQGYDSVAIRADVELGGTEQKFNLMVGRALQEAHEQPPQVVLTLPILPGLDGRQRMSKSLGNYIGVLDAPSDMFGKVMSLPDSALPLYWRLVAGATPEEVRAVETQLADARVNPVVLKKRLGQRLVALYHGEAAGLAAQESFETQFSRRGVPADVREHSHAPGTVWIQQLLVETGLAKSGSDARRAVEQERSVEVEGQRITDIQHHVDLVAPVVLRRGRRMVRVTPLA